MDSNQLRKLINTKVYELSVIFAQCDGSLTDDEYEDMMALIARIAILRCQLYDAVSSEAAELVSRILARPKLLK